MDQHELLTLLIAGEKHCGLATTLHLFYGANVRVRMSYSHRTCARSIDELQLSVRAWNALKRSGVDTIGELIDVIQGDGLMRIRNLGRKSMVEIKTKILEQGFRDLSEKEKMCFFEYLMEHNSMRM